MEVAKQYAGKKVFVTGNLGFKGSHLVSRLKAMGATVYGFDLLEGQDVRDLKALHAELALTKPDYVFHLAAQAFVPVGYTKPIETFETNALGTANVLEALRRCALPCAVVIVTTDKCYAPNHDFTVHEEDAALGGRCPYSSSKAAAEHVVTAYREGFFAPEHGIAIATARAGNVIGGGDWGEGRLIPNMVKALKAGTPVPVFNAEAVRPWQYVTDVVDGYLRLGAALNGPSKSFFARAWNFGPTTHHTVQEVVEAFIKEWGEGRWELVNTDLRETDVLKIDSSSARAYLRWRPQHDFDSMIKETAAWYR